MILLSESLSNKDRKYILMQRNHVKYVHWAHDIEVFVVRVYIISTIIVID